MVHRLLEEENKDSRAKGESKYVHILLIHELDTTEEDSYKRLLIFKFINYILLHCVVA